MRGSRSHGNSMQRRVALNCAAVCQTLFSSSIGRNCRSIDAPPDPVPRATNPLHILFFLAFTFTASGATTLRIEVVDEMSRASLPCRVHLLRPNGQPVKPPELPFWHDHFVCEGRAEFTVDEDELRYEIERGPEWSRAVGKIVIKRDEANSLKEKLSRITNLAAEGWWSGETHVHRSLPELPLLMRAEDLHVALAISWWNNSNHWLQSPLPANPVIQHDGNRFFHVLGGEDERGGGALLFHQMRQPLPLATFPGKTREWPSSARWLDDARRAGAWIDAEKPFWWDFPLWLARGVDSVGIAHNHLQRSGVLDNEAWGRPRDLSVYPGPHGNGEYSQRIWWDALNCGLRLTPSAGSASGVLPNPVGYNRMYVHCEGELTWEKWWDGFRAGRVFVTNGPLLRLSANGELPGATLKSDGAALRVNLAGRIDSRDPIERVELIHNGEVERIQLPAVITLRESGWFVVRAISAVQETFRFACTAPWTVEIAGKPGRPKAASAQFFLDWTSNRIAQLEKIEDAQKREDLLAQWREVKRFWEEKVASARPQSDFAHSSQSRPASDDAELRTWLESMVWHHHYMPAEIRDVLGLDEKQLNTALARFDIRPDNAPTRPPGAPLLLLPYPGGRHPRIGFLEGAVNPQRETKLSIFPPWPDGGYVCLDVPEALWSNLGLTYLAHTHIDTIWTKQGVNLPRLEWQRRNDGGFSIERPLPNGISFAVEAIPKSDHVALTMRLRNGSSAALSDLRVQMCAMLKAAHGFEPQSNDNKLFEPPFAAVHDATGQRWIIHAWEPIHRVWGNAPCPCLHADPKFPDCPPGEMRVLRGWLSFFQGSDIRAEFRRISQAWSTESKQ